MARLRAMNGAITAFGFATVSTPTMPPRASRTGAATCMTVASGSAGSGTLERAPYSPRSVRATSFQRE